MLVFYSKIDLLVMMSSNVQEVCIAHDLRKISNHFPPFISAIWSSFSFRSSSDGISKGLSGEFKSHEAKTVPFSKP